MDDRSYYIRVDHDIPVLVDKKSQREIILCKYCLEPTVSVGCHGWCELCGWAFGCGD